jgi:hypothetical protein
MHMRIFALSLLAAFSIASASCSKEAKDEGATAKPEPQAAARSESPDKEHGSKDAKPGSHEDWCGEHAVPESQCTRCNASLVPAFKATGDWCADHGLPKSQCLKCNPDLKITRPPKEK